MVKGWVCKGIAVAVKVVATKTAEHYANTACPLITYQPRMSEEVKKLRKF